jgi:hypothetical protein
MMLNKNAKGKEKMAPTDWHYQDVLRLSVNQWGEALQDTNTFDANAIRMVQFVYHQNNHESTASAIAEFFTASGQKTHYNRVCAWNRKVAKALYHQYGLEPPVDETGEKRYWNVVFDGEPKSPLNRNGHFFWKLRPNLISAFEALHNAK